MRRHVATFAAAAVLLGVGGVAPVAARAEGLNTISAVRLMRDGAQRSVRILGSHKPSFQRFTLQNPFRLVLDFVETQVASGTAVEASDDTLVESIQVDQQGVDATRLSRVMITFKQPVGYALSTEGNEVVVAIATPPGAGQAPPPAETRIAQGDDLSDEDLSGGDDLDLDADLEAEGEAPAAEDLSDEGDETPQPAKRASTTSGAQRVMTYCGFQYMGATSRVFVRTNDKARFNIRKPEDTRVILELENTRILVANNERFLDTQYFKSPVKLVTPESVEGGSPTVRVEIQLRSAVPFEERQVENEIWIDFPNPS